MLGIHFTEWQRINTTAIVKLTLAIPISILLRFDEVVDAQTLLRFDSTPGYRYVIKMYKIPCKFNPQNFVKWFNNI